MPKDYLCSTPWMVDIEWAKSFIGMRLKVTDSYWNNCYGRHKHDAKILDYIEKKALWCVELDDKTEELVHMRWDAIVKFADRGASNFNDYPPLPPHPVIGDADKPVEYRGTVYKRTEPEDWIQYLGDDLKEGLGKLPRKVVPVPFEGDDDLATVNITDEDLEKLKDKKTGTIRFEKVFHWCLARFPKDSTTTEKDWQATRQDHYEQFLRDPDRGSGTRTKRRF